MDIKRTKLYNTLSPLRKVFYVLNHFSLFYFILFSFSGCLLLSRYVATRIPYEVSVALYKRVMSRADTDPQGNRPSPLILLAFPVSEVLRAAGWLLLGFAGCDCALYYLSGFLLSRTEVLMLCMFYMNGVSSLLSSLLFLFFALVYLKLNETDYLLRPTHSTGAVQVLSTCFFALLTITAKEVLTKRIRMSFNHTNYLTRIEKCLVEHQFVKTLETVKRKIRAKHNTRKKSYWVFSQDAQGARPAGGEEAVRDEYGYSSQQSRSTRHPTNEAEEGAEGTGSNPGQKKNSNNTIPDQTAGAGQKNASNSIPGPTSSFYAGTHLPKLIIFKEFDRIMNTKRYRMEKSLGISPDLKQYAEKKAEKISQWLQTEHKKFQVKHLRAYVDAGYINSLAKTLGLSDTQSLSQKDIAVFIERARREKYAVKKSLVQMDRALLRVGRFITAAVLVFALTILLSSAIAANDIVKGILGTFFGLGFIFQTSVKNAVDSVIFLFIVHPYDIGDRVHVEIEQEEMNMVVSELNVFSTVFYRWDGTKIYVPNHILLQKPISNIRRSGTMAENIKLQVAFDTPAEKIQHLKVEIGRFIRKHPREFGQYFLVNYHEIENTNKLHLKIYLQHASNWQNYESYLQRRAKFIMFLKQVVAEQGITYALPPQRMLLGIEQTKKT